jgi:hypothetical protein
LFHSFVGAHGVYRLLLVEAPAVKEHVSNDEP